VLIAAKFEFMPRKNPDRIHFLKTTFYALKSLSRIAVSPHLRAARGINLGRTNHFLSHTIKHHEARANFMILEFLKQKCSRRGRMRPVDVDKRLWFENAINPR
jgi:hypothetical protein